MRGSNLPSCMLFGSDRPHRRVTEGSMMRTKLLGVAGAAVAFLSVVSPVYSSEVGFFYSDDRLTTLAVPGATNTEALGVNDRGQIVGDYQVGGGIGGVTYARIRSRPLIRPSARAALGFSSARTRRIRDGLTLSRPPTSSLRFRFATKPTFSRRFHIDFGVTQAIRRVVDTLTLVIDVAFDCTTWRRSFSCGRGWLKQDRLRGNRNT